MTLVYVQKHERRRPKGPRRRFLDSIYSEYQTPQGDWDIQTTFIFPAESAIYKEMLTFRVLTRFFPLRSAFYSIYVSSSRSGSLGVEKSLEL